MSTTAPASLKALAEDKSFSGVTKTTSFRVDPNLITLEEGFNLREEGPETDAHIERLYLSYKNGAFVPPVDVSVVDGKITAREGHCRTRAAIRLRLEVPEFTLECRQLRGNEADYVLHMLGTGTGGKPLNPLEQGNGFKRLLNYGLTPTQIATKLGVTRVTVDNGLALAEAPVAIQEAIRKGEVSATTAREAIRQGTEGTEALKTALEQNRTEASIQTDGAPVESAAPAKKKKGKRAAPPKKKKVTARALKGTAAERKPSNPDEITVTLTRKEAANVATILRQFSGEDADLLALAAKIEMAAM